jgi:hypothetical protein
MYGPPKSKCVSSFSHEVPINQGNYIYICMCVPFLANLSLTARYVILFMHSTAFHSIQHYIQLYPTMSHISSQHGLFYTPLFLLVENTKVQDLKRLSEVAALLMLSFPRVC